MQHQQIRKAANAGMKREGPPFSEVELMHAGGIVGEKIEEGTNKISSFVLTLLFTHK